MTIITSVESDEIISEIFNVLGNDAEYPDLLKGLAETLEMSENDLRDWMEQAKIRVADVTLKR